MHTLVRSSQLPCVLTLQVQQGRVHLGASWAQHEPLHARKFACRMLCTQNRQPACLSAAKRIKAPAGRTARTCVVRMDDPGRVCAPGRRASAARSAQPQRRGQEDAFFFLTFFPLSSPLGFGCFLEPPAAPPMLALMKRSAASLSSLSGFFAAPGPSSFRFPM